MSVRLERAMLLYQQGRFDLAEKEARQALADDPDDALAHAVLSEILVELKQYEAATDEAKRAIGCAPNLAAAHAALASVLYRRHYFPEAEQAISQAILFDPTDANSFALLAGIRAEREDWDGALDAAEQGLQHDAEHSGCSNLRSMALVRLGRKDEAGRAAEDALKRHPDDAFTHATRGWGLLHEGDPKRALEHFREALRLNAELEYARMGMIEALKARYWLYRQVLNYFLWLARLSPQARWGIVIGLLVMQQIVASTARANPELRPFLEPVLIAYVAFALTTWTAVPLSNLFLRLNRFGRLALSREQSRASFWVGLFVLFALAGVVWGLTDPRYGFLGWPIALGFMILLVPISGTCACQRGWPRRVMLLYTIAMVGVMAAALTYFFLAIHHDGRDNPRAIACLDQAMDLIRGNTWAGLISSFLANWLAGIRPRL